MPHNLKLENRPAHIKLGTPRPVDVHVGARLRQRRILIGMSQEKLGEAIGLTFQQVQKYERGANRIGASRIYQLSNVLAVSVSYFFDDMPADVQRTHGAYAATQDDNTAMGVRLGQDVLAKRLTLELARAFYAIPDEGVRQSVFELIKSMGKPAA